jgi:hypothetical protein
VATDEKVEDVIEPETIARNQRSSSRDLGSLRPLEPMDNDTVRKATRQQTHRRSEAQEAQVDEPEPPQLLACLLILPSDAEPIVSLLRTLAARRNRLQNGDSRPMAQPRTGCRPSWHFEKYSLPIRLPGKD